MNWRKGLQLFLQPHSIAFILLCLCLFAGWKLLDQVGSDSTSSFNLLQSIHQLGFLGKLIYACALALAIVISPIPGTPLTIAAGLIWEPWVAGIYGVVGVFLGSLIAYFLGRTLGRSAVQALTGKQIYLSNHKGEAYLGWVVFITHLLPILPFDLISYGAGLAKLSFKIYATSTLLGTFPCVFFLTYLGASFAIELPVAITIATVVAILLIILTWGVRQYNWLGIKDIIRIE
jgi:uncharacterized membrane protein YdjX (TVP38/TMEM64 family)